LHVLRSRRTGEAHGDHSAQPTGVNRCENVGGASAGGEGDKHITGTSQSLDLASEDVLVRSVIRYRSEYRRIGRERNSRPRMSIDAHSVHELRGEMLRVRSTSAITADKDFSTLLEARADPRD